MSFLRPLALRLNSLVLRRPRLACLAAGALSALAIPPFGLLPLLFVTLGILHRALAGATIRQGFARGWCFSFGLLVCGLYWIAASMFVDLAAFWWAIPLAVAGLPLYLSLYTGLAGAFYRWLDNRFALTPAAGVLALAALLSIADIGRGTIFTGFPWIMLGQSWQHVLPVLQSLSLVGIYGLTLLTLLLALSPVLWAARDRTSRRLAAGILLVFVLLAGWGAWRLAAADSAIVAGVQLRLLQPNIPQTLKMDRAAETQNFQTALDLATLSAGVPPTHIIWPEAAVPFLLDQSEGARLEIGARTPAGGLTIMGAPWRNYDADGNKSYSNSLATVDAVGAARRQYDKFHLVPFGEYFPWRAQLMRWLGTSINAIAAGQFDFTAGPGPRTIDLHGLPPVSPLVCYEIIFSGEVTEPGRRPGWLLNITNDAWFGTTTGPYQHFEIARQRAIEEGLPLVRVANTGISGIVDGYGRIRGATQLNTRGALDMGLPVSLPPTLFSRARQLPFLLILLATALLGGLVQARRRT